MVNSFRADPTQFLSLHSRFGFSSGSSLRIWTKHAQKHSPQLDHHYFRLIHCSYKERRLRVPKKTMTEGQLLNSPKRVKGMKHLLILWYVLNTFSTFSKTHSATSSTRRLKVTRPLGKKKNPPHLWRWFRPSARTRPNEGCSPTCSRNTRRLRTRGQGHAGSSMTRLCSTVNQQALSDLIHHSGHKGKFACIFMKAAGGSIMRVIFYWTATQRESNGHIYQKCQLWSKRILATNPHQCV